ncbi:MAG: phosphoribosylformylglycinamidine synthase subunit PurQ [Myxococcales bacterium FL481]|nr:MAG: phosphoribosylformylglycinamidine synthase subunit PurQ [Myxococcales bacterium FL481]
MDSSVIKSAVGLASSAAARVRVLVMTGYGLNCEAETQAGFEMLGTRVTMRHVSDLVRERGAAIGEHDLVVFIGGFSFGDHVASGRVLANRLRARLGPAFARFIDAGGLVLGMCNGFQVMVKLGLLPALGRRPGEPLAAQTVSLVSNERLGYRDAWVKLGINADSPCVFTRGLMQLDVPSRHAEGKLVFDPAVAESIEREHLVPVRYLDDQGDPTTAWPDNPNGSPGGAAGLCDRSGRIFGLMPHPEAYLYPENHPRWLEQRDQGQLPRVGQGLRLLANGVRAAARDRR